MDCGPTCLRIIAKYYGRIISLEKLRKLAETSRSGSSLQNISKAAENIGFRTLGVKINLDKLKSEVPLPCILHWKQDHFVVLYEIKKNCVSISDPAVGLIKYSIREFLDLWIGSHASTSTEEGIALLLETTHRFKQIEEDDIQKKQGFLFLFQYLYGYKRYLFQLILGLFSISVLQLIFPFLTQSIVDIGIQNKDINFLHLILIAQLFVFIGRTGVEIVRSWILLHLSTRINISLVSDFLIKLMKLPLSYFDVKMTGDLLQRIGDHSRIENLLTNQTLSVLFSILNFVVFGAVLCIYSIPVFLIFLIGTSIYFIWILVFLRQRRDLDHKRFVQASAERSKIIELIGGMQEIKLHNAERQKRWGWENIQVKLFKINIKNLNLNQLQNTGSNFINEVKNIIITFYVAKLVISGDLTLGMMLSVSYITGQLSAPISQFLSFIYSVQDAKISLERLSEIHNRDDEEDENENKKTELPENLNIRIHNLNFRYIGVDTLVLKNLNLEIPQNKITAIVGSSGSGKTTLMKILLRFYEPTEGKILLGNSNLNEFKQWTWRNVCGSVMQEGFIFNDTIANNIAVGEDIIDKEKLLKAIHIANIQEFIESLPLSYNTKIGSEGVGISTGQKQRILIARAVYKDPQFLFFDEATSALDSKNEKVIMENLNEFMKGRTSVIIAHRLSTVKNADQIVVLGEGGILEKGTHSELLELKNNYYSLVKNQLELEKLGVEI